MAFNHKRGVLIGALFCIGGAAPQFALSQTPSAVPKKAPKERARTILSKQLPPFGGTRLKATLIEVHYGPGEASHPHSHPCAVMGYVTEGTLRFQVQGEPLMTLKAGESFYEAPNVVHLVSGNASATEPASFVAYLLCDRDTPLSIDVPPTRGKGDSK